MRDSGLVILLRLDGGSSVSRGQRTPGLIYLFLSRYLKQTRTTMEALKGLDLDAVIVDDRTKTFYLFVGMYIGLRTDINGAALTNEQYEAAKALFMDIYDAWMRVRPEGYKNPVSALHAVYWLHKIYQMEFPGVGLDKKIVLSISRETLQKFEYYFACICEVLRRPFVALPWLADMPPYAPSRADKACVVPRPE